MKLRNSVLLALAAVGLTMSALWFIHRPAPLLCEATWEDVQAEARRGGYQLINTPELAERYQKERQNLLLVDTRQDWEYRSGHLKGAVNFPLEPTWWGRWRSQRPLAELLGPDKDRFIVFYCAGLA